MTGERLPVHDRGKALTQAMLMLAGGGESCADIEHLRAQRVPFGAALLQLVGDRPDKLSESRLFEANVETGQADHGWQEV